MESLESLRLLATVTWINPDGGAWEVASNWDKGALPGPADDVVIPVSATITHSSDLTSIHSLRDEAPITFTGGSLTLASGSVIDNELDIVNTNATGIGGPGDLTVNGPLTWSGGTMSGLGTTRSNGMMIISGPGTKTLNGRTLNNPGAAIWTDGSLNLSNGATLNNLAGAIFAQGSVSFTGSSPSAFNNAGTFLKMAGGTATVPVVFNNTGTVDVQSGTLALTGGGSDSGSFTVEAGATLTFAGGAHALDGASSVAGDGAVTISGLGTVVTIAGAYDVGGTTAITGGFVNFLNDAATGTLALSGGFLTGPGDVTVNGLLAWSGGNMAGAGATTSNGVMSISAGALSGRTLNNAGAATLTGTLGLVNGAALNNLAGATFDAQGAATFTTSGSPPSAFNSAGTFLKSVGGTTSVPVAFNNTGAVDVQSGALALAGGGSDSGSFTAEAGATLAFAGGTYLLDPASSVAGDGAVAFIGSGAVTIAGAYDVAGTTAITGGTTSVLSNATFGTLMLGSVGVLTGPGDVTVNDLLAWSSVSVMTGTGTTTSNGALSITGFGTRTLDGRTLNNAGTATWTGGTLSLVNGAALNNLAGATLDAQGTVSFTTSGSPPSTLNNAGTFLKSVGGTTSVPLVFNNSGTVDVQAGTLSLTSGGTISGASLVEAGATLGLAGPYILDASSSITGGGNVSISGFGAEIDGTFAIAGTTTVASGTTVDFLNDASTGALANNGGTVNIDTGTTLDVVGAYTQATGGRTNLNGAALNAPGGVSIASGSSFFGLGTINGDVTNAGTLNPGTEASPGILNVNGSYTQTATGALNIKIGGRTVGTQYDQLNVTGLATLNGTLNVILIYGFLPSVDLGDQFTILTYNSRFGAFTTATGLGIPTMPPSHFELQYGPNALVLVTVSGP